MTTTVICLIAGGVITAANVVIILISNKRTKAFIAWYEAQARQHSLEEFEKRRMCSSYCKHKDTAETQEDLDWICASCPLNNL